MKKVVSVILGFFLFCTLLLGSSPLVQAQEVQNLNKPKVEVLQNIPITEEPTLSRNAKIGSSSIKFTKNTRGDIQTNAVNFTKFVGITVVCDGNWVRVSAKNLGIDYMDRIWGTVTIQRYSGSYWTDVASSDIEESDIAPILYRSLGNFWFQKLGSERVVVSCYGTDEGETHPFPIIIKDR